MIQRIIHGNRYSKVSEVLFKIGSIHQEKSDYEHALNAFYQALDIAENFEDANDTIVIILNEIYLIYQFIGDTKNAIKMLQKIVEIVKTILGEKHICAAFVLGLLRNIFAENGMVERSKAATKEIQAISTNSNYHFYHENNYNFVNTVMKLFGFSLDSIIQTAAAA